MATDVHPNPTQPKPNPSRPQAASPLRKLYTQAALPLAAQQAALPLRKIKRRCRWRCRCPDTKAAAPLERHEAAKPLEIRVAALPLRYVVSGVAASDKPLRKKKRRCRWRCRCPDQSGNAAGTTKRRSRWRHEAALPLRYIASGVAASDNSCCHCPYICL